MTTQTIHLINTLQLGEIELRGEFLWGSNYTFLANVRYSGETISAVYKPSRGVRPLWDFPQDSLAKREVATYLVSEALGWQLVPLTIYRDDAPFGPGSMQLFVEHDPEYHYFRFSDEHIQRLRPTVLFDILINNADRKGSHVLIDPEDHLWLIDHGLCFHSIDKLRTVIWDFVDEVIPSNLIENICDLQRKLESTDGQPNNLVYQLSRYLNPKEIKAINKRAEQLVAGLKFPAPDTNRRYFPWPEV